MRARARSAGEPKGDGVTGFPFDAPCEGSWKLSLPCTKAEAEGIADDLPAFALLDQPPVLMTSEPDPARPDAWRLDAYFEERPDAALIALVRALAPSAGAAEAVPEHIEEQDWVTLSQSGLEPIRVGRFHVHTPTHGGDAPPDMVAFAIEAGRAFGTGHHETTTGCLLMLDRLARQGARFANIADVGTGTGLLAFAARACWPLARIAASDIDPVAIEVSARNAEVNGVPIGLGPGRIELVTAPGLAHPSLKRRAPYDLIVANILAGPLIELAPVLSRALRPGGSLVLAGLLERQAGRVADAYRCRGMRLADTITRGDWPVLRLVKRRAAAGSA